MILDFCKILYSILRGETVGQAQPLLVLLHDPSVPSEVAVSINFVLDLCVLALCVDVVFLQFSNTSAEWWV